MGEDKARYSAGVQAAFDDLWRYVREWFGENEGGDADTEKKGGDTDERMQALLAAMKELIQDYA